MDAFYASVEQRDHPELRGKPIAVGGAGMRGVVASASYEARKFGVRSAMPSVTARRLCPQLIFVRSRFDVYRDVSHQIRDIFLEYTDLVEPLSLDEAYLDVTDARRGPRSATLIAGEIRRRIREETGLTASAGVSFNKFLAKVASDINKPDGQKVITPEEAIPFLEGLPIDAFHGIGKVTAEKMRRMGIFDGAGLKRYTEAELVRRFGKVGRHYYRIVRADDGREVNPNRIRKSIGAERTYKED
ncbi:MAG: DNA polymerase IV, partial [Phaeodactylibacter sp.]|nr:DNA polymerase IV [Phaeodactylibacter sp.]